MAIWGKKCGLVITGKDEEIEKVYARNGKESKLYTDIKEQLKTLPKEALQTLKDTYKSWEDGIIHSSERLEDIALAIYAKTQTSEFKKWFGDSKVVDDNGEPLIVYHGTHNSFDSFDKSRSGDKTGKARELPGFYFFDHSQPASDYTIDPKGGKAAYQRFEHLMGGYEEEQLREIYFDLFKAYDKAPESEKYEGIEGFAWNYFNKETEKGNVLPVFLSINNPLVHDNKDKRIESSVIAFKLKPNNDGVKVEGVMDRLNDNIGINDDVYIAFEPNQIKSVFNEGEFSKDTDNIYHQTNDKELEGSKMSDVTVSEIKEHFKRMNVDYDNTLKDIVDEEGNKLNSNETVDVFEKVVKVITDKENVAIGEAGMHIVTRIIKQTDPKLYKEMMSKINKYNLYDAVVERYKKLKDYQLEDGKPNIPKIKEEVIGKVLNEYFIKYKEGETEKPQLLEQTQSWWDRIVERLKGFFIDNPFERAAKKFDKGEYDETKTIENNGAIFHQLSSKEKQSFDKDLDNHLLDYLSNWNVQSKEINDFKERFGVDSLGVADVINKMIYYSKNRKLDTIAEEASHIITMLMGRDHELYQRLLFNIEQHSTYPEIYKKYMPEYNNVEQVKKEAVDQLIAEAIVHNWKLQNNTGKEPSILQKLIDKVKEFFDAFIVKNKSVKQYKDSKKLSPTADIIAKKILAMDKSLVPETTKRDRLDYEKALENNDLARSIINSYPEKFGVSLTGSLGIAGQGELINRPTEEPIHDIDFVVSEDFNIEKVNKYMQSIGAVPTHSGIINEKQKSYTYAFLVPEKGYDIIVKTRKDWGGQGAENIQLINDMGKVIYEGHWDKAPADKVLNVDFFNRADTNLKEQKKFANWQDIYYGKLILSNKGSDLRSFPRIKDQMDYIESNPVNREYTRKEFLYFQLADKEKGDVIFDNIKSTLAKVQHIKTANENYYNNLTTGQKILKRVTDRVKKRLEKIFTNKVPEKETDEWLQKSETGVKGHADVDDINNRYIDKETGLARRNEQGELTPLAKTKVSQINSNDARYYEMLEQQMVNLINTYSSDTKFIWENPIYDQKFDEVGTPDFMAIHKNGVVDIYDWKFLDIKDGAKDLAAYKKEIFNIQLDGYVDILKSDYGVEKIGKSRIIPIKAIYTRTNGVLEFKGIEIANSDNNYKSETREYLLPFPTNAEIHRENPQIQSKIEQLNKLAKELNNTKGATEESKLTIKHRMQELKKAIRHIQVKEEVTTGVEVANAYLNNVGKNFKEYVENFKNETDDYTDKDLERIARELNDAKEFLLPFNNLEHLFKDAESKKELQDLSYRIQEAMSYINQLGSLLIEKGIANPRNMFGVAGESSSGLIYADKMRSWGQNLFDYSSNSSTKMAQLFHRVRDEAYQKVEFEMGERLKQYSKIAEPVQEWIKKNSSEKLQDALLKKGEKWGLINKYSDEFTTSLNKAIEEGNTAWIKDNIRVDQYMEKYKQNFEKYSKWAEDTFKDYTSNKEKNKQLTYDKKLEFEQKYDIKNFPKTALSHSNDLLRRFPSDDPHIGWLSKEYKYLLQKENKPLLDVYDYMQGLVKEAQDLGILDSYDNNFFPQIYKTMTESLAGDNKFKSVITNLGNAITLKPGDRGYINEITREPEKNILVNFVRDLGKTTASGTVDYSHVSKDILSAISLFEKEIVKYKYVEEIEPLVELMKNVEREKDVLVTNTWNQVIMKDGKPVTQKNDKNADYLETMIDFGLYGIKGAEDQKGLGFKIPYNKFANKINDLTGSDLMPLSSNEEVFLSVPKFIETVNKNIAITRIGANVLIPISNFFGGAFQSYFNTNTIMREDLDVSKAILGTHNFVDSHDGQIYGGLMQYFNPFVSDQISLQTRRYKLSEWNKWLSSESLMFAMRKSTHSVEMLNSYAYMKNLMVKDGKLVHIYESLKEKYDYAHIYDLDSVARKKVLDAMTKEYKELKENASIVKTSKIENDQLVIPGLNKNDASILTARAMMQQMTRDALGDKTPYQRMNIDNNIIGTSLMLFHRWIPPLVEKRGGSLQYNAGSQNYTYGRWRMLGKVVSENGISALGNLIGHITGNEQSLIDNAKTLYSKKRAEFLQTGEVENFDANMTEAEFIDMYKEGMVANLYDAVSTMLIVSAYYLAVANAPDDDSPYSGVYKTAVKVLDKFSDELAFFYSPASAAKLVGNVNLPVLGVAKDAYKFLKALTNEMYFDSIGDEESADKNKVLKYPLSHTPVVNQVYNWWMMFDDEAAVEFKGKKVPNKPESRF